MARILKYNNYNAIPRNKRTNCVKRKIALVLTAMQKNGYEYTDYTVPDCFH